MTTKTVNSSRLLVLSGGALIPFAALRDAVAPQRQSAGGGKLATAREPVQLELFDFIDAVEPGSTSNGERA